MKPTQVILAGVLGVALVAAMVVFHPFANLGSRPPAPAAPEPPPATRPAVEPAQRPLATLARPPANHHAPAESGDPASTKLGRLTLVRERFRALAAGDRITALRAAKEVTDDTERETALLTLVTEWTRGELGPPRARARAIAAYGLEAGLGLELARDPALAVLWANELADGPGRAVLLQ